MKTRRSLPRECKLDASVHSSVNVPCAYPVSWLEARTARGVAKARRRAEPPTLHSRILAEGPAGSSSRSRRAAADAAASRVARGGSPRSSPARWRMPSRGEAGTPPSRRRRRRATRGAVRRRAAGRGRPRGSPGSRRCGIPVPGDGGVALAPRDRRRAGARGARGCRARRGTPPRPPRGTSRLLTRRDPCTPPSRRRRAVPRRAGGGRDGGDRRSPPRRESVARRRRGPRRGVAERQP